MSMTDWWNAAYSKSCLLPHKFRIGLLDLFSQQIAHLLFVHAIGTTSDHQYWLMRLPGSENQRFSDLSNGDANRLRRFLGAARSRLELDNLIGKTPRLQSLLHFRRARAQLSHLKSPAA